MAASKKPVAWGATTDVPMPHTLAADFERERIIAAVTNMAMSRPPLVFANRFLFTTDMVQGGQGIVVFAHRKDVGMHHVAIKCASREAVAQRSYSSAGYIQTALHKHMAQRCKRSGFFRFSTRLLLEYLAASDQGIP
jgi:hypothetical protein